MKSLVLELQADALNKNIKCSDLLRKALVVSRKLGVESIEEWLHHELNGYPLDENKIPNYREIRGQINVLNPHHGWQPLNFANVKEADCLSKRKIMQPIGELDTLFEEKGGGALHIPFDQKTINRLMNRMRIPLQPALHVSRTEIVGILDTVRNTVLEWALELEAKNIVGEGMTFSKEEKQAANQITYQITNNIGHMQNSQLQQDSDGSSQIMDIGLDLPTVLSFIAEIRNHQKDLGLTAELTNELETEILTIELQSKSPKPKTRIVSESLKSIRTILEGVASNAVASMLLAQITGIS